MDEAMFILVTLPFCLHYLLFLKKISMTNIPDLKIRIELIKKQECFFELSDNEAEMLAAMLSETTFNAGQSIVIEGSRVDRIYIIVSGTADVRHVVMENKKVKVQSIATLGPNDAIGLNEEGFYSKSATRTATVVATTAVQTYSLSVSAFYTFAEANPHVNEVMYKYAEKILGF